MTAIAKRQADEERNGEDPTALVQTRIGLMRPIAQPEDIIASQNETRALITKVLDKGRDFGIVPGTDKPSLLKPGAERVCLGFGCFPRYRIIEQQVDHFIEVPWLKRKKKFEGRGQTRRFVGYEEERGTSFGLYRYVVECEIVARELGIVVGQGLASCSTMESKYIDRPRDSENTVLKMAKKRAHVGATLNTFGLSDQFTQDVEDNPDAVAGEEKEASPDETGRPPAPPCPKCTGPMSDNRDENLERVAQKKKRIPDFKCKQAKGECKDEKGNATVIWHLDAKGEQATGQQEKGNGAPQVGPDDQPITDEQSKELQQLFKARGFVRWHQVKAFLLEHKLSDEGWSTLRDYEVIKAALEKLPETAA